MYLPWFIPTLFNSFCCCFSNRPAYEGTPSLLFGTREYILKIIRKLELEDAMLT